RRVLLRAVAQRAALDCSTHPLTTNHEPLTTNQERTMTTATMQEKRVPNQKSGLGSRHGVKSEATALFRVKPGHAAELRAASKRFADFLKAAPFEGLQHIGLHYSRL